ncbi:MAG TPA: peptidyl-alpha-hydroxyglycine alpha-amidating lyase family protein [Stellaceae bacterium]|nr:peptidyl-alpha-hydroxyglycine alpha-amidating lyase family protein [Stellaceae bacterium]
MADIVGSGDFQYRIVADWGRLPDGWSFKEVAAVAVDHNDNVYCFNRGEHPMMVFDRDGNFLRSWGEGQYPRAHGAHMAPDESLYLTDDGAHCVRKCRLDGRVLLEIGIPGKPAAFMSGEPFHRCTHTALSPSGEIYVSDGYGNARVHKFSADAQHLFSWGEPGAAPGQFNLPHGVWIDRRGRVLVADRENDRVQVFDQQGKLLQVWPVELIGPAFFYVDPDDIVYVPEHNGGFISILTLDGERLARWGDGPVMRSTHGIWGDSQGNIYAVQPGSWTPRARRIVKYERQ